VSLAYTNRLMMLNAKLDSENNQSRLEAHRPIDYVDLAGCVRRLI
jgi:hypothetical protein